MSEPVADIDTSELVAETDTSELVAETDTSELVAEIDTSHLVTEDDEPVDSWLAEKNQRLLASSLFLSWAGPPSEDWNPGPRTFLAAANVGLFNTPREPGLVPDVMVSTDVELDQLTPGRDETKSYFIWEMGKPPELVIEIVSDRAGDELGAKRRRYARMQIGHYVVWDPRRVLSPQELRVFEKRGALSVERRVTDSAVFDDLGLGVRLWEGSFESTVARWLRFTDGEGELLATPEERVEMGETRLHEERSRALQERTRADSEQQRADAEQQRADSEQQRADSEQQRAERLAAKLRALGVDPDAS